MKIKPIFTILAFLMIAWFLRNHFSHPLASQTEAIFVQTAIVKEDSLPQEAHAIGTLTARSVEITPEIAGHVQKILFKDGESVKELQPLIQLDDAVYRAKYASVRAKYIYSDSNYKRMALLGKRGVISKQAIDQADADLKEKKADADESEVMLNKMQLTAPFNGVVGKAKVNQGDYVTIGQSVVTVTDVKHLRIEYNVPDKFLPLLKLGQEVKIITTAYPTKIFKGIVSFISPTINSENRSLALYAEILNDDNLLAPGMFVDVIQSLNNVKHVMMIPARSLMPILDGEQVYKVIEGKAYAVNVSIGNRANEQVEITHGLLPGDVVITDGQLKVKNGLPIKIKP